MLSNGGRSMSDRLGGPGRTQLLISDLKSKYVKLHAKLKAVVLAYRKARVSLRRLSRNNAIIKRKYLFLQKHASQRVRELMETINRQQYQLVFDEERSILSISENFLEELGMDREEFSRSFYVDILFEKFLPQPDRSKQSIDIPAFQFPVLIKETLEADGHIHPFIHLSISGKLNWDAKVKRYLYLLNAEDISSTVELNYFQRTDTLVSNLSIANLNLLRAKKTIEMHKTMLISLVCSLVGEYSKETSLHLRNLQHLASCLSSECKRLGLFKVVYYDIDEYIKDINYTSVLHDIGKMAIPSAILEKDGELTTEEQQLVRKHPEIGANYIKRIIDIFEDDPVYSSYVNFLRIPYEICRHHHERWDGTGYPDGLVGEAIPMPARIISVVDTYEAIRGRRSYIHTKPSHQEAVDIIAAEAGMQFDPKVVEAFLNVNYRFESMH